MLLKITEWSEINSKLEESVAQYNYMEPDTETTHRFEPLFMANEEDYVIAIIHYTGHADEFYEGQVGQVRISIQSLDNINLEEMVEDIVTYLNNDYKYRTHLIDRWSVKGAE